MAIDAPLTYGQLSTWRSIATFAADRLMEVNVPATWDLRGLTAAAVRAALDRLVERHESLRTTYHVVDGQPVQRIHPRLPARITWVERAEVDPQDADRYTRELYQQPFPVTGDAGWHGVLSTVDSRPRFLSLSLSHLVVDLWAIQELEAQFRTLVSQPDADLGPAPAPRDLAAAQRGESWSGHRRRAEKYWHKLLTNGPVRNLAGPPPGGPSGGIPPRRIQATLRSHRLAVLAGQAAKLHGVSPQSVLLALTAAALGHLVDSDRVMLSVMSANRFDPEWQSLISTQNQLIPLVCDVDPDTALVKHLKRTHLGALLAYRYGSYDVDRAAELTTQLPPPPGSAREGGFEHDCWFNYVTEPARELPATGGPGLAADLAWTPPPRNAGHPFYARVNGDGQNWIAITLRVDPELIPAESVIRALRGIALGIQQSVTAPESTLGSLRDAPVDALPPSLFPTEIPQYE